MTLGDIESIATTEHYSEAVRIALGSILSLLGRRLVLSREEQSALVELIVAHQIELSGRAMNARNPAGRTGQRLRARKRRLDVAIRELIGPARFAQFVRYRRELNDAQSFW